MTVQTFTLDWASNSGNPGSGSRPLIIPALVDGGIEAYLATFRRAGTSFRLNTAGSQTESSSSSGPQMSSAWTLSETAITIIKPDATSLVMKGPAHADNTFSDDSEPHFWTPDNSAEMVTFLSSYTGSLDVLFDDGVVTPSIDVELVEVSFPALSTHNIRIVKVAPVFNDIRLVAVTFPALTVASVEVNLGSGFHDVELNPTIFPAPTVATVEVEKLFTPPPVLGEIPDVTIFVPTDPGRADPNNYDQGVYTTHVERALEKLYKARISEVVIHPKWDIDNVPEEFLPYLAWELSADAFTDLLGVEHQRRAIRRAHELHTFRGTKESINRFADIACFSYALVENVTNVNGIDKVTSVDIEASPCEARLGANQDWIIYCKRVVNQLLPLFIDLNDFTVVNRGRAITRMAAACQPHYYKPLRGTARNANP